VPKVVAGVWAGLILVVATLSLWPGGLVSDHYHIDKLGHFGAYALLAFLPAILGRSAHWLIVITVGLVAAGILLEVAQLLVPGRVPSFIDGLANTTGVLAGFLAGRISVTKGLLLKIGPHRLADG